MKIIAKILVVQQFVFQLAAFGIENPTKFPNSDELVKLLPVATINKGEKTRIISVMKNALQGKELNICAIGGSITAGANASDFKKTSYLPLVYNWWVNKFPKAKFNYVNAGIGATTSIFGVHRAERDLLKFNPDFTMVDFTVNDNGIRKECAESYEGLIRKIFINRPQSAIVSIAMVNKKMENVEDVHVTICKQYEIPMLSVKQVIEPMLKSGRISWSDWSNDDIHPIDNGHTLIAGLIINYLEECYKEATTSTKRIKIDKIKKPLTKNGFENSSVFDAANLTPTDLGNWTSMQEKGYWLNSWAASSEGKSMLLNIKCKSLIVGYRKNVTPTNGKLIIKVDGIQSKEINPNFPNGWGAFIANETLFKDEKAKEHSVEFIYSGKDGEPIYIKNLLIAK
jgi:lysophospholipase L1-like esterase